MLDVLAVLVTAAAIAVEAGADRQLRRFLTSPRKPGQILDTGLWAFSRHPNYFGEVLFWWGVWLFGLAADPSRWWTIVGPAGITALFLGISVPMMDKRMLARHPGYAEHISQAIGISSLEKEREHEHVHRQVPEGPRCGPPEETAGGHPARARPQGQAHGGPRPACEGGGRHRPRPSRDRGAVTRALGAGRRRPWATTWTRSFP